MYQSVIISTINQQISHYGLKAEKALLKSQAIHKTNIASLNFSAYKANLNASAEEGDKKTHLSKNGKLIIDLSEVISTNQVPEVTL